MIKNIIFDLGNVLFKFNPLEYLRGKFYSEDIIQKIKEEIFSSEEWVMLDRGEITQGEAISRICSRNEENAEFIKLVMDNWYEMLMPIEEVVNVLKELKGRGYKVYYLSNFHMVAFENITKKYDFMKSFHGGIVSYEEKLLKPEREIYIKLIDKYKINPGESIFIDDTAINVEAAEKLRFHGIHFRYGEELKHLLGEKGVI